MAKGIKERGFILKPWSGTLSIVCRNTSGAALARGDVVVWDTATTTELAVTTTTSADDKKVAGVCAHAALTGASVEVITWGWVDYLKANGTTDIAVGDELSTYTSAGIAAKAGAGKGGAFALAFEAYATNDSLGVLNAFVHAPSRVDALATTASLDDGYNNGATITVDGAAVVLAGSHATNDVLQITNATGTGALIDLAQSGTGADIEGTSDSWTVSKIGDALFHNVDLNGVADALILDADADTHISSPTDDQIDVSVGGTDRLTITNTAVTVTLATTFNSTVTIASTLTLNGGLTFGATLAMAGNKIDLDADADTSIIASTDDQIDIEISGANDFQFTANAFTVLAGSAIVFRDSTEAEFGTDSDAVMGWEAGDVSNETLVIGLADANQALHISDKTAIGTDWNVGADTHPSLYIHSDTTPATDYVKVYHDATTGFIAAVGGTLDLTGVGSVTINDASADVDFRVETNSLAFAIYADGGKDALVLGANTDVSSAYKLVSIDRPARTGAATTNYADLWVEPTGAYTVAAGTTSIVASVYLAEPNITLGGQTVTSAATLYIANAPTEGGTNNNAIHVASGSVLFQTGTFAGAATFSGTATHGTQQISLSTGNITFSGAGYVSIGATPANAGYIRLPNAAGLIEWRNAANDGNITLTVNASNQVELTGSLIFEAGRAVIGGSAANTDLTLDATSHATVATAYIISNDMIDATTNSLAIRVKAGAIGDAETAQTDLNGELGIDSTNGRFYFRYGAAWHYTAITAGFVIPEYERECPICGQGIGVGDVVAGVIEGLQADGALHGLYTHMRCVAGRVSGVDLPQKALHEVRKPKASVGGMPNAAERKALGLMKDGDRLVPVA